MRPTEDRTKTLRLKRAGGALGTAASLLLIGCGSALGDGDAVLQPMLALDEGRYSIRSVAVRGVAHDPDVEHDFRERLNDAATVDAPIGRPVDVIVNLDRLQADVALENPSDGHLTVFRDVATLDTAADLRDADASRLDAALLWVFVGDPTQVFADISDDDTGRSGAAADIADIADIIVERLIEPGLVALPQGAAFASPPPREDDRDATTAAVAPAPDDPPLDELRTNRLDFGVYGSLSGAMDEVDRIRRASAAIDTPDLLTLSKVATGYAISADALAPDVVRSLCAARRAEGRVCDRR